MNRPRQCQRAFPPDFRLLLASQSPRRRELLVEAGIPHQVVGSAGEESIDYDDPFLAAESNAAAKAGGAAVPAGAPRPLFVLGADTIVVVDGQVLGKPADQDDARRMLLMLSDRAHSVITGVALVRHERSVESSVEGPGSASGASRGAGPGSGPGGSRMAVGSAETEVWFRRLEDEQLNAYLSGEEWSDKAGAYGIQGQAGLFVERIEGDYPNVVGLPLSLLVSLFGRLGFDLLARRWLRDVGQLDRS